MPTGVFLFPHASATNVVDDVIASARAAYDAGVRQVWLAQQLVPDAIGLAGLIGNAVPGLGVGTAVVPINPRHPLIIAAQAQTAQAAAHGNFSLGLGLGAHAVETEAFGYAWPNTVQRLREHLTVLRTIFETGEVDFHGEEISAVSNWPVRIAGGTPIPVYVAAMGPKALRITGELADGTMPFLAGPRTLREFIVPTITEAAERAGRPAPRIIAAVPTLVHDDLDAARVIATERLAFYQAIPSYQKVIAREGLDGPVTELAALGKPDAVTERVREYRDAGATDIILNPLRTEPGDLEALWEVARNIDAT
ncbi:MAG: LLM class F420-dependent oxidoreductase [Mycolicibacterium hassiacum]|jgi:F420-dependent oxidoreductase-like protein|uniref:LLM class F420-dependent oxidoreductase n=1 Tax=Mycolicibacterium hassiacum TaxID=46351 RepID=UPI000DB275DD|nr:LLM class F420-dependent oxidoreductase [Mycolicibacterium hassiacum]MBX5488093.1 LLM class F420-dependent oxidoreductase [Mycolicibacterium hassiacum]PZN23033.1 MAG: LLM class F420-dependent oxidoreductase [Mycolicibacterium hassiacum]